MWACLNSHIDIVKLLLDRGASPNIVSEVCFKGAGLKGER